MGWPELAAAPLAWADPGGANAGNPDSAVIFTRLRIFRNFAGLPFVVSAPPNACQAASDRALDRIAKRGGSEVSRLIDLPAKAIRLLREREILPPRAVRFPGKQAFKYVAIEPGGTAWTLVNEVEHVAFGRLFPGFPSPEAFAAACGLSQDGRQDPREGRQDPDQGLWAWSPSLGYLASDPSRIGPGLGVEMLVHLPGLGITRQLPSARNYLAAAGAGFLPALAPSHPPAVVSRPPGPADIGLFRLAFRGKLGKTAEAVYASVLETVGPLLRREHLARKACLENRRKRLEERLEQALLRLSGGASITYPEALAASSMLRLGAGLGMADPQFPRILEELRVKTASGHLAVSSGKDLSQEEEDFERANVVRSYLEARSGEIH